MRKYEIGVRKFTEQSFVRYWMIINAKPTDDVHDDGISRMKSPKQSWSLASLNFIEDPYWRYFILFTIILNTFITINCLPPSHNIYFIYWVVIVHLTCLFYLIDFWFAVAFRFLIKKKGIAVKERKTKFLVVDAISLIPLSLIYLLSNLDLNTTLFWTLRSITLLRFYRIPQFLSNFYWNHWKTMVVAYVLYTWIVIDLFTNFWIMQTDISYDIYEWNKTRTNEFIVCLYFAVTTVLNVGFGDILPITIPQILLCCLFMIIGFILTSGVITGALATGFANKEKKRETYRQEYESAMNALKSGKVDKSTIAQISNNWLSSWRYKKGFTNSTISYVLPLSMQKEIHFDVTFGFLNRSLIFSLQPRSFLRSVSLTMENVSYFPGDIIFHPSTMREMMLCVASGVIEILSDENDETPLISFTTGTILGEVTLFVSIPVNCVIRASTYVELQVLMKMNFSQMALKYPEIYRTMREEIVKRIHFCEDEVLRNVDDNETMRRKATKRLIQELKKSRSEEKQQQEQNTLTKISKSRILDLYVVSENIPRTKTLPINLIRTKPWILRPHTSLIHFWEILDVVVVTIVSFAYPYLAVFVRRISFATSVILFIVQVVYITDLYIQCTTAIERNDHFTYITSLKQIIIYKLKSVGFYVDVLATFDFTIYGGLIMPDDPEYIILLLSLNRLLKFWHIPRYFEKLENNVSLQLFPLRTFKYFFFYSIMVVWSGATVFLEAYPGEVCIPERWYARLELSEVNVSVSSPRSTWPSIVSLYFGSVIVSAVGYGDLVPKSIPDCLVVILWMVLGVITVTYCTAQASATMKHGVRNRIHYQEEVFAVNRFMADHELSKELQSKVRNYFRVQWNYDKAFALKHHQLIGGMSAHQRDIMINAVTKKLMTVPVFQNCNSNFLRMLAKNCKLRVYPPNEVVTYSGSHISELYILENGFCEVSVDENLRTVIGPLSPFGYLEMILGIPLEINVVTLTHSRILSLDYYSFVRAATKFPAVKAEINSAIEQIHNSVKGRPLDIFNLNPFPLDNTSPNNRALLDLYLSKDFINVYNFHRDTSTNYWEPFRNWGKFRFFQFLLLPIVVTPNSLFLKIWVSLRVLNVLIIGSVVPIHFSLPQHTQYLRTLIFLEEGFFVLDMYLMFHVAYYDRRGLLMFHPAKTATCYLKHTFLLDLISTFPFYLVMHALYPPNETVPSILHDAPGFIMVLQFYKFFQACYYLEDDILQPLPHMKTIKFILLSLVFTNIITGFLVFIECHGSPNKECISNDDKQLQYEYERGIELFCSSNDTNFHTMKNDTSPLRFYLIAYYWVTATMTTCGFGDVVAHNGKTMIMVIIIIIVGLFLYGYMFASLTSTMISAYNSVTKYRRRLLEMSNFMKEMNANNDIQQRMILHYEYNWQRSEGTSPQKMFLYVPAALRETIVASMYEDTIRQVPVFLDVEKSLIRVIGKYSEETYFLGGETIVKYNDIQQDIYIIYRGKVDVMTATGRLKTSMGSGGLFGNISEKPFSLSSVNVIATKNVDLLKLNSRIFFRALKMAPNTKPLIELLNSRNKDYIKPQPFENHDGNVSTMTINDRTSTYTASDDFSYELNAMTIARRTLYTSEEKFSTERIPFYLKNSIFVPHRNFLSVVILHDSWLYTVIELSVFMAAYISSTLTYYTFCFQDFSLWIIVLSYILDFIFVCKILVQFNLTYFDKYGNYVTSKRSIRTRYYSQKKVLGIDIAANLPLDFLAFLYPTNKLLLLSILRLNRILRLHYIYQLYDLKNKVLLLNKIYLKLSWILCHSILLIHFSACFWYFITCPFGIEIVPSWVTNMNVPNATNVELYTYSIYYIISLCTTTGYGQLNIVTSTEIVVSTVFMIMCRFGVALLAGSMAAVINVHSLNLFLYVELISDLRENLSRQKLSLYQMSKMWKYLTSLWLQKFKKKIPKFIETAPYVMKCEVMNSMFGHHLSQSYLFSQEDEAFLKQLAVHLKLFVYFPGNYIVQQGDIDHTMYFIHKGQVLVLTIHRNLTETIHYKLQENDHFGMTQGLLLKSPHRFSYRAETEVAMLSLTLSDWQILLKYFPEAGQHIYERLLTLPQQIAEGNNGSSIFPS